MRNFLKEHSNNFYSTKIFNMFNFIIINKTNESTKLNIWEILVE